MDFTKMTVFCLFTLQAPFVRGVGATGCDNNPQPVYYLRCTFPLNVNITRKEFTVYYKADDGGTGSLVDCRWPGSTFFCFKPEGVDCVPPVSDRVNIAVSGRLACMHATFTAKVIGNVENSSGTCEKIRLSDRLSGQSQPTPSTKMPSAECSARKSEDSSSSLNVTCLFHQPVDSFDVVFNGNVVDSYTKTKCEKDRTCLFQKDGNEEMYSVQVNSTAGVKGDFICKPRLDSISLAVAKGCHVDSDESSPREASTTGLIVGVLVAVIVVIALLATVLYVKCNKEKVKQWKCLKLLYSPVANTEPVQV